MKARRPALEFAHAPARWIPDAPAYAYQLDAASTMLPYLEPYLIKVQKLARERLDPGRDADLIADIDLFNRQEANHFQLHARYNETLRRHYPGIEPFEAEIKADLALLGIDRGRAGEVDFSPPYLRADFTFLVPPDSKVTSLVEVDQPGTRVAIVSGHAMETALRGQLLRASPVHAATPDAAFELLRAGKADVLAGIRPGLLAYAAAWPGARVLDLRYGENLLAIAVAKGHRDLLGWVSDFVAAAKGSGLMHRIIAQAGLAGVDVPAV